MLLERGLDQTKGYLREDHIVVPRVGYNAVRAEGRRIDMVEAERQRS